jgi:eukaryotic-like serine/threonine-protein kinase
LATCPACRAKFGDDLRFCPNDGTPLNEDAHHAPAPPPTPVPLQLEPTALATPAELAPTQVTPLTAPSASGDIETRPASAKPVKRASKSKDDTLCGKLVDGRYRILERIGEGGVGVVYSAEHVQLKRKVALKVLHPLFAPHSEFRLRFEREAQAASRTSHPACVAVLDFGTFESRPYLVMEFVEGRLLSERLQEKALTPSEAVLIARQVLGALRHAHSLGIIHRDVKPGNIMLCEPTRTGAQVKLLDFGLAKNLDSHAGDPSAALTMVGAVFGTPGYLSPEQAAGVPVDARSDLYSLGVVLFEMVCCRKPFTSDDQLEVLQAHISTPPPKASTFRPDISTELEDVIARALDKNRDTRFQSADDFIDALTNCPEAHFASISGRVSASGPAVSSAPTAAPPAPPAAPPPPEPAAPVAGAPVEATAPVRPDRQKLLLYGAVAGGGLLLIVGAIVMALVLASWLRGVGGRHDRARPRGSVVTKVKAPRATRAEVPPVAPREPAPAPAEAEPAPEAKPAAVEGAEPPAPAAKPAEAPSAELKSAEAALKAGRTAAAIRYGRKAVARQRGDAKPHLVLGHAYYHKLWDSDAFDEYGHAIAADGSVRNDRTVQAHAIESLAKKRSYRRATRFIVDKLGAAALPALEEAARSSKDGDTRRRAAAIVETLKAAPPAPAP